ncbi:MAG: Uma2 family endonuclease [Chloroflexales bacterium]|nr:Uma2 family endonuclease [Chloroflexales bacterium]
MADDHTLVYDPPATQRDDDTGFEHYYDLHPTKEDLMGESTAQSKLIFYLLQVLEWLYRVEGWFIISNLNIYSQREFKQYPITPDVAVFKGVVIPNLGVRSLRSWRLYEPERPPPQVVFEISSKETWRDDLRTKPAQYAELGVHEYYAYDPKDPPYWPKTQGRLCGWWREGARMVEQTRDAQGRLWSAELASWLAPDGTLLRLYDQDGSLRLTEGEAERVAKEAERAAKERALAAHEAERVAKEHALAAEEAERVAKEAERAAKERAWAQLRALGVDPDEL